MANQKISALTENTTPAAADIAPIVDDPGGTPLTQKITLQNLVGYAVTTAGDMLYATAARTLARLALGTSGYIVTAGASAPQYVDKGTIYTRYVEIEIVDKDTALTTGNGKRGIHIPTDLNGYDLTYVHAFNLTASSSGAPTFQVHNLTDTADMLSTALTIDANERGSDTAATPAVINAAADDVVTNDIIQVDVDGAGTGTKGVYVTLGFRKA